MTCIPQGIGLVLIWSDSMGAKSFSLALESSRGLILVDPGAAALQPGYPLPRDIKRRLRKMAVTIIKSFLSRARYIFITHYHHDHFMYATDPDLAWPDAYRGKKLIVKNPNMFINRSQWMRARTFIAGILQSIGRELEDHMVDPWVSDFPDPLEGLEHVFRRDYGDYEERRRELLEKGRRWFDGLRELWVSGKWIGEVDDKEVRILFGDGRVFEFGDARIHVGEPWFHGVEYDRTGWVTPLFIEKKNYRIVYTSDLMGPIIEDYAYRIADWKPDIIVVDGPPLYLYPYMFNRINLGRAIDNLKLLIDSEPSIMILDHHVSRKPGWRKYFEDIFVYAEKKGVYLTTYADCLNKSLELIVKQPQGDTDP